MPPSIVITEPVARWKAWARYSLKVGAFVLFGVVSFQLGTLYERQRSPAPPGQAAVVTDPAEASASAAPPRSPGASPVAEAPPSWLAALALEGLQIQALDIGRDPGQAGRLRYAFEVLNEGRLYEGSYEFLMQGIQLGRPMQWTFPVESQPAQGAFRLRVARYLKTTGSIQLPADFIPQAMALRLKEPGGLRASRGLVLPEDAAAAQVGSGS